MYRYLQKSSLGAQRSVLEHCFAHIEGEPRRTIDGNFHSNHTATNLARRHEPPTKSQAHHLERLVEENTMDSGIMARLEVEDPLLACHDQTAGWLNRVWVESGR